jgi:hypothetical protein
MPKGIHDRKKKATIIETIEKRMRDPNYIAGGPIYGEVIKGAKRDPVSYRFDILDPSFLRVMAKIADYGAKKYGDLNWHKSRLTGQASPVNHIMKHLTSYAGHEPYDHPEIGNHRKMHLAAIAFNAMMEFWYEEHMSNENISSTQL